MQEAAARLQEAGSIVKINEPMCRHTSFRVGGCADLFLPVSSGEMLKKNLEILKEFDIPYYIMGNGTNLLVKDGGFRGAILQLFDRMCAISTEEETLTLEAGALLSQAAAQALSASLTGLEFAAGIPGTLGGAVAMNAGAYGGEMKDVIVSAEVLLPSGEAVTLSNEALQLSYRQSRVSREGLFVLRATLQLSYGDRETIQKRMQELMKKRQEKQPLAFPSAGSTFKRPEGYFAGKLIQDSGLSGKQIGGAQVSEKHAGFIINRERATAADILNLIAYCQKTVFEKFGVELVPEVKMIGEA